ncbi:flagellar biosynthetic protein FliO [Rhizobium sp. SL86]|uniref:flagellar biosynthetic protein FliO n=1 Tax=Rhizobium sp. SL86 TaxID=2995148 RepID=UPI002275E7A7|nr:flagellar biosynthetic protein FliO [Rhizobium sp. SL86]MCY1668854.1 flagellar biosynthetic protein FliO [Rhizobium sp. SL86]
MIEDLMSDYGSRLFIAIAGVGLGLLCLFVVLMMMRRRTGPAPFLRGGKNRQPRLQVLDAAAVDARRRIVLIRRDDVEHLVMIGGPTDVVIESGIGAMPARPVPHTPQDQETAGFAQPAPEPRLQAPARQPQLSAPTAAAMPALEPAATASLRERVLAAPASATASVAAAPRREQKSPVATKVEPAIAASERSNPAPSAMITAPATPQPEPRLPEPRLAEPAQPPKPEPARETVTEIEPPAPARQAAPADVPDIGAASDALDAARRRVFQPALDRTPQQTAPMPANVGAELDRPSPPATQPEPQAPRGLGSDFDRILEEEMANNLAEVHAAPAGALPRRDPANPRLTGASPEPSLQQEVARIFGEMSVTRDDRP